MTTKSPQSTLETSLPHEHASPSINPQPYVPPSSLARPARTKKPTQKLLDSIAGQSSTKKSNPRRHQANVVSHTLAPPQTFQET